MSSEWKVISVGDFVTHQKGFAFKSKSYQKAGIPVARVSNFTTDSIDTSELLFVSEDIANQNKNVELKENDIVIATVGSWPSNPASIVGKTIRVPSTAVGALLNQNAVRLRVKSNDYNDQIFLYYVMRKPAFINYLVSTAQGSANQASITLKDIFSYKFGLPGGDDRKIIGQCFNDIDKKIELNRQINQTLEQIAQAIFKSWFVDFDPVKAKILAKEQGSDPERAAIEAIAGKAISQFTSTDQLASTAALFPDELVESEVGLIPKGWKVWKMSEMIKFKKGKKPKVVADEKLEGFSPHILISGFTSPVTEYAQEEKAVLCDIYDPVMVMDGASSGLLSIGHNGVVGSTLAKIKCYDKDVNFGFIYCFLKQKESDIRGNTTGTSIPHTDKNRVLSYKFAFPVNSSLSSIFEILSISTFDQVRQNKEQSQNLAALRDTLLPKLLSGDIELKEAT